MSWFPESKDRLPYTWWKGQPVYLAAIIAIGAVASMILTALLMAAAGGSIVNALVFSYPNLVERLYLWTPLTHVIVNPPSLWLILGAYLLWRFGEQVERHLGRRSFVKLLLLLTLAPPAMATLLGLFGRIVGPQAGFWGVEFGVFVAFATLYPRAQLSILIATIEAWVLAAVFVGIAALSDLANRDIDGFLMLFSQVGTAFAYIRFEQGAWKWPQWGTGRRRAKFRVVRRSEEKPSSREEPFTPRVAPDVDAVLEKISREGMASLTDEERSALERASSDLSKRSQNP
jgi:membrane associated rhomboid family serine protease